MFGTIIFEKTRPNITQNIENSSNEILIRVKKAGNNYAEANNDKL